MATNEQKATPAKKAGMDVKSGFVTITPSGQQEFGADYLSWHAEGAYRYWIQSRLIKSNDEERFFIIAFEVELIGTQAKQMPTKSVLDARVKVALNRSTPAEFEKLTPSVFRNIPLGTLFDAHADMIADQQVVRAAIPKKNVELVSPFQVTAYPENMQRKLGEAPSWMLKNRTIQGATNRESILIAYLYSQQVKSGSLKPASRVASLLAIDTKVVYTAIRIARRNEWLTSGGTGKGVGELTALGKKELENYKDDEFFKNISKIVSLASKEKN